jgi:hypothetical protein
MARKRDESGDIDTMFEKQQRRLNRKRLLQSILGIAVLVAAYLALQLTPYRDLPREVFDSTLEFVTGVFSGGPSEPDAKYW